MTAFSTFLPSLTSAISFICGWELVRCNLHDRPFHGNRTLRRTMAEISWAEKVLVSPRYSTWILGWPLSSTTLKGQDSISFLTVGSSKRRPIRRLDAALTDGTDGFAAAAERQPPKRQDSLGIEDGVAGVHGSIVLSGLTDQTLLVGEGDERGGGERTLLVGNDFDIAALVGSNARVGSTCAKKKTRKGQPSSTNAVEGKLSTTSSRPTQRRAFIAAL